MRALPPFHLGDLIRTGAQATELKEEHSILNPTIKASLGECHLDSLVGYSSSDNIAQNLFDEMFQRDLGVLSCILYVIGWRDHFAKKMLDQLLERRCAWISALLRLKVDEIQGCGDSSMLQEVVEGDKHQEALTKALEDICAEKEYQENCVLTLIHAYEESMARDGVASTRRKVPEMVVFPLASLVQGILGGLFGIGGGLRIKPVFLQVGVPSQITAVTTFMVLLSSSMSAIQHTILGMKGIIEILGFAAVCIVASSGGVVIIQSVILKSRRVLLIVFSVRTAMAAIDCIRIAIQEMRSIRRAVGMGSHQVLGSNTQVSSKAEIKFSDRISNLPEPILVHILSYLCMEDVITTNCLSKRYSVDNMDFYMRRASAYRDVATLIDKAIALHSSPKIKLFRAWLSYQESYESRVDSWIRFAVDYSVEQLDLDFVMLEDLIQLEAYVYLLYSLLHCLFGCGSLMEWELNCGNLNSPPAFCLPSLKKLMLMYVELVDGAVMNLTSNCPVLEELALQNCNRASNLNISIVNQSIKRLQLVRNLDTDDERTVVELYVPYLLHLELYSGRPMYYCIRDVSSVVTARLEFEQNDEFTEFDDHTCGSGFCMLAKIIFVLREVKNLRLSSWCIQILVAGGCETLPLQCSLLGNFKLLKLDVELIKYEFLTIDFLLRNSPALESLTISLAGHTTMGGESKKSDCTEYQNEKSELLDLSCLQHHLKRVIMEHFAGTNNEINLLKFILKNSPVLKEIIIMVPMKFLTGPGQSYLEHCSRDSRFSEKYLENIKDLLQSPRASLDVEMAANVQSTKVSTLRLISWNLISGGSTTIFLQFRSVFIVVLGFRSSESLFSVLLYSRSNLATIDENNAIVTSRKADTHFEEEGPILCAALDGLKLPSFTEYEVRVRNATEHRCEVVVKGPQPSGNTSGTDPLKDNRLLLKTESLEDTEEARYRVVVVNKPSKKISRILVPHPLNASCAVQGKDVANVVLLRDCGIRIEVTSCKKQHGPFSFTVTSTKFTAGLGMSQGIDILEAHGTIGDYRIQLTPKATTKSRVLSAPLRSGPSIFIPGKDEHKPDPADGYDFGFLHIKAIDEGLMGIAVLCKTTIDEQSKVFDRGRVSNWLMESKAT